MESSLNTLAIMAEVTTGFVAFSAIVASLRVSFGEQLSAFQKLLVQFFTMSGMLTVSALLMPLVIVEFWQDEPTVASYSILYMLMSGFSYLVFYINKRRRVVSKTPVVTIFVMSGYAIFFVVLFLILIGVLGEPTLGVIVAGGFWGLTSSVLIFAYFLSDFVNTAGTER
jgi:hypothetical protein